MAREHRHEGAGEALAADVRATVAAAERVAESVKQEAEERARARLRQADREAERIIASARDRADELVDERRREIAELSDAIMRDGASILERIGSAQTAKGQLDDAVAALGEAARLLGRAVEVAGEESGPVGRGGPAGEPPVLGLASHGRRRVAGGGMRASQILGLTDRPPGDPAPPAPAEEREVSEPSAEPARQEVAPEPTAEQTEAQDSGPPPVADDDPLSSARLLALHMAVSGTSREETRDELQRSLGVADPDPIVDEVFEAYEARR